MARRDTKYALPTANPQSRHLWHPHRGSDGARRRVALGAWLAALVLLLAGGLLSIHLGTRPAQAGSPRLRPSTQGAFGWLVSAPAPATWGRLRLSGREGVLSVPPPLHAVAGDHGTVSAARVGRDGTYLAYLNATPLQGDEQLRGWAGFRLEHLRDDDARSAVEVASASMLHFRGGTGSCVIDDYVTDVGAHQFREIACLVVGGGTGSVVVATTPPSEWAHFVPLLERSIAGYSVG